VVVSDSHGVFSSPRTAFTFYAFGHDRVSILDGGLPAWIAAGLPTESGKSQVYSPQSVEYTAASLRPGTIRSYEEMVANARMASRGQTVLDARPNPR
jgi:thiosulfate/3-mercaptopyruvate sulfurtransferase